MGAKMKMADLSRETKQNMTSTQFPTDTLKKLSPKKPEINIEIINLPDSNNMKLELKNNREDVRFAELNEIIEDHLNCGYYR